MTPSLPTTLYLVRHGESHDNHARRVQGWSGSGLTDRGRAEAAAAGRRLRELGITALYSSDLQRASETAAEIATVTGLPVRPNDAFREIRLGPWEGRLVSEVEETDGRALWDWRYDGRRPAHPEIEPVALFRDRLMRGLEAIVASGISSAAIVSHGGAISVALTHIVGLELLRIWQMPTENGSISRITHDGERFWVSSYNETGHLPGREEPGMNTLG